jgi:hypothetical protein
MPDVFGLPQDKAANTASRLASRYDANTAWNSLDATPSWQFGGDMREQYIKHIPRRGQAQILVDFGDIDLKIDRSRVTPARIDTSSAMGPGEVMQMAKNFPATMQNTILSPIRNLAGKFMA